MLSTYQPKRLPKSPSLTGPSVRPARASAPLRCPPARHTGPVVLAGWCSALGRGLLLRLLPACRGSAIAVSSTASWSWEWAQRAPAGRIGGQHILIHGCSEGSGIGHLNQAHLDRAARPRIAPHHVMEKSRRAARKAQATAEQNHVQHKRSRRRARPSDPAPAPAPVARRSSSRCHAVALGSLGLFPALIPAPMQALRIQRLSHNRNVGNPRLLHRIHHAWQKLQTAPARRRADKSPVVPDRLRPGAASAPARECSPARRPEKPADRGRWSPPSAAR